MRYEGLHRWVFASKKYVHISVFVNYHDHHDKVDDEDHVKTYANVYMLYNVLCKCTM